MTGMTGTILRRTALHYAAMGSTARLVHAVALLLGASVGATGCGALDVSDPTAVEESELSDAAGAALLRSAAMRKLAEAASSSANASGLLTDEFLYDLPVWATPGTLPYEQLDRRESVQAELVRAGADSYRGWKETRHAAAVALPKLRTYLPAGAAAAKAGEMFVLRGYATLRLAEDFCPGFPLHDLVDLRPVYTAPLSTEETFAAALAAFDSAVTLAADSARILHFAQVGQARTLLGLGRFAEARTIVMAVPTAYVVTAEYLSSASLENGLVFGQFGDLSRSVANAEGGTGLDFVSAEDPRLVIDTLGVAIDGATGIYGMRKYPTVEAPIVVASGIEARLIEAEAALNTDPDSGEWLAILNTLRTEAVGGVAGLAPLADPGTSTARVDLLFRERAFWLFATGHRLGDLRRLVAQYGRSAESVFPSGPYRLGGTYGSATSIPFPAEEEQQFNPAVTGCTSR